METDKVITFAKKRKQFSTQQVASHFKIRKRQAAACIAIMRIKGLVERGYPPETLSGSSRWVYRSQDIKPQ